MNYSQAIKDPPQASELSDLTDQVETLRRALTALGRDLLVCNKEGDIY
jgi:hypothetical protein